MIACAIALACAGVWSEATAQTQPSTGPATNAVPSTAPRRADPALDRALAERLYYYATLFPINEQSPQSVLLQSASLLEVGCALVKDDTRFHRAYIDVCLLLGRRDEALASLQALRRLDPSNQLAQIQTIDLAAQGLETAEQKAQYLAQVVAAPRVPAEVRSHAAFQSYLLSIERGDDRSADEMLRQALQLNPQNLAAIDVRLAQVLGGNSTMLERAAVLRDKLGASPMDAAALITLGHLCAGQGLYDQAVPLYELGIAISGMRNNRPPQGDLAAHLGALAVTGDARRLAGTVDVYLPGWPTDPALHTFRLIASAQAEVPPEQFRRDADTLRGAWLGQLANFSEFVNHPEDPYGMRATPTGMSEPTRPTATTLPTQPMPPVEADAAKLIASTQPTRGDAMRLYADAIAGLCFHDLFVRRQPVPENLTRTLANLVGEQSPTYARIEGWRLLITGQRDAARAKLEAVAATDDLAMLGLVELDSQTGDAEAAKKRLTELLARHPQGLEAGYAALSAKAMGVRPSFEPAAGSERAQVRALVKDVLQFLTTASSRPQDLYMLSVEPVKLSFDYNEPIIATVTLRSSGGRPITVGNGGFVEDRVVFDANVQVMGGGGVLPYAAIVRLSGPVRLGAGQVHRQTVRLDQARLITGANLQGNPTISIPMRLTAMTNAIPTERGSHILPGGVVTQVGRLIERRGYAIAQPAVRAQLLKDLQGGPPELKLRRFEMLSTLEAGLRANAANSPGAADVADELVTALTEAYNGETQPRVRAWMLFSHLLVGAAPADAPESLEEIRSLIHSSDVEAQLVGLLLATRLPEPLRKQIADEATRGVVAPARPVSDMAEALRTLVTPPATQPATQPATVPAAGMR